MIKKRFYDRGNRTRRATQMFLKTFFNKFTIIQQPQACSFCGCAKTFERQNKDIIL